MSETSPVKKSPLGCDRCVQPECDEGCILRGLELVLDVAQTSEEPPEDGKEE